MMDGCLIKILWTIVMVLPCVAILVRVIQQLKPKGSPKHPPGPKGWPIFGNLFQLGPQPYKDLMKMHEKYGPLIRLKLGNVNVITMCSPNIIKEIIHNQDEVFASRPKTMGVKYLAYDGQDIALAPYGTHWKNMRRICMEYLLTTRRIESYMQHRKEEAKYMISEVMKSTNEGKIIKLRDVLGSFSMNVMTRMLLSKRYFGSENAGPREASEFLDITHKVFWLLGVLNIGDYVPLVRLLDLQGYEKLMREVQLRMDAFHSAILEEHRQRANLNEKKENGLEDFVDILLSLPGANGEDHLNDIEMKALIQDMIAAAIDTSSVISEWAMSEMLRNPEILKKAQEEVDQVVGKNRNVKEEDLGQLRYLRSIVKETFRLHPAGPFLITHEALKDTVVEGYYIPKKTQVLVNVYALGRNPNIWSEKLEEFWPDRWMEDKVEIRDEQFRILPFSAGRRRCPGAPLGQIMVLLSLSSLIHCFDWSLQDEMKPAELNMMEGFGLTMPRAEPLLAIAKPRLDGEHLYN